MKKSILLSVMFLILTLTGWGQVMPSYNLTTKILKRPSSMSPFDKVQTVKSTKSKFWPFRGDGTSDELSLADAFNTESVINGFGIGSHSIFFDLDTTNSRSVYTEALSIIPKNNWFKFSIGTNIAVSELKDSTKASNEIAYQKLLNGGGNFILGFSRPVFLATSKPNKHGDYVAFLVQSNLNFSFDVKNLNQIIYEPGFGVQWGLNADCRLYQNAAIGNGKDGNLFRIGLKGGMLYNFFNEKYNVEKASNPVLNSLFMYNAGIYIGVAMFDISISFNGYSKDDLFFDDKKWALRVGIVPVKF